jgi:hypothetical protein
MRVAAVLRASVQLLALVLTVAGSGQLLPHTCPEMAGAHETTIAAAHDAHEAPASDAHEGHGAHETPDAPTGCQCVDDCCCVPAAAPARTDASRLAVAAVVVVPVRIDPTVAHVTVAVPHLQPFAIGPPATPLV